jgi:hypothetical protein
MRAQEFVAEAKSGKIGKRRQSATRGLNKFRDSEFQDRIYELNRVMMAAAMSDGVNPINMDGESWAGRYNTAHPYTEVEQRMLKQAYKACGSEWEDINHGDLDSGELDSTNVQSPVQGFKGYPR